MALNNTASTASARRERVARLLSAAAVVAQEQLVPELHTLRLLYLDGNQLFYCLGAGCDQLEPGECAALQRSLSQSLGFRVDLVEVEEYNS